MQIITQFYEFFGEKMFFSAKALIYGNKIAYFYMFLELSNVVNKNDVASNVNQKLRGGVKMTTKPYNGIPK